MTVELRAWIILYLDPGSASFLLQALIGAFFGFLVLLKAYWKKVTNVFRRKEASKAPDVQEGKDDGKSR